METGIFKYPTEESIFLGYEDVAKDDVVDRIHHGGIDKACYAYSSDHYEFWKKLFPEVDMTYGAFGENLTISGLNESQIQIGDKYEVGTAIIEVAQPRQPCMKLGIRFNDQSVVKLFIQNQFSGVYFRVINPGSVKVGDELTLIYRDENSISVAEVHSLMGKNKNLLLAKKAIQQDYLAESYREDIKRKFKI